MPPTAPIEGRDFAEPDEADEGCRRRDTVEDSSRHGRPAGAQGNRPGHIGDDGREDHEIGKVPEGGSRGGFQRIGWSRELAGQSGIEPRNMIQAVTERAGMRAEDRLLDDAGDGRAECRIRRSSCAFGSSLKPSGLAAAMRPTPPKEMAVPIQP